MITIGLLIASFVVTIVSQQNTPYKLTPDRIGQTNTFKLQCKDSNGLLIPEAVFFRNGALNTSDDCFNELDDIGTGYLQVSLTSECDGRYMCGTHSGSGYIISGPTEVFATPTINYTDIPDIQKEEGEDVLIHCPFSESPLGEYQVSLWRNVEGVISVRPTLAAGDSSNDLILSNVTSDDSGMYFCRLQDTESNPYNGPNFRLQVFPKFAHPQILNDITYSMATAANGDQPVKNQFTVGAAGTTPLSYSWTVNGTRYNATEEGDLLYWGAIPNGKTKVKVTIENIKFDNTYYSDEQVLIIEKGVFASSSSTTPSCGAFSSSHGSGNTNIALLVITVLLFAVVVFTVLMLFWQKFSTRDKKEEVRMKVGSHQTRFDKASLTNLPEFFDRIDFILGSLLVSIPPAQLNPAIAPKVRELKAIIGKWNVVEEGPQEELPPTSDDQQISRGGRHPDKFKLLLPKFSTWLEENIYE